MINKKVATLSSLIFLLLLISTFTIAQCTNDAHSTNENDGWISCQPSANPNSIRGNSHWIQYDLGYIYNLTTTTIWNYNVENKTGKGFKDIWVDYSVNGTDWVSAGQFQLPEASGTNDYTGFMNFDFENVSARYVLLTAQNNWNGGNCAGLSEFKIQVNNALLPIELMDFSAEIKEDFIRLNWESQTKNNFSHFEIERSIDATNFSFLSEITGDTDTNFYEFDDENVKNGQLYFYRLKMVDLDGSYTYSSLQTAQINKQLAFAIYPNPTINVLHVAFEKERATEIIIQNATGHEILRIRVDDKTQMLDISRFPAGMYFCSVVGQNSSVSTKRFVKAE